MVARYTGAWQEYSQRIAARHQIISLWFGSSTGLLLFFAKQDLGPGLVVAISVAMPALSAAMFSMLLLHDLIMQRLTEYMRACESFNNEGLHALPNYRADLKFQRGFIGVRSLQNIVLAFTSLALFLGTYLVDEARKDAAGALAPVLKSSTHLIIFLLWFGAIALDLGGIGFRGWREWRERREGKMNLRRGE